MPSEKYSSPRIVMLDRFSCITFYDHLGLICIEGPYPCRRRCCLPAVPAFQFPIVSLEEFGSLSASALSIALVAFAVLSRTFALRGGGTNLTVTRSASRTPVAEAAGAKSKLTGLVGAVVSYACFSLVEIPGVLRHHWVRKISSPPLVRGAIGICQCITSSGGIGMKSTADALTEFLRR
jgi:hypothetical protein